MDADLYGYKWARDNVGQSGATIYRLYGKPDAPEVVGRSARRAIYRKLCNAELHIWAMN